MSRKSTRKINKRKPVKRGTKTRKTSTSKRCNKKRSKVMSGMYKPRRTKKYIFCIFMFIIIMTALYYIVPDSITITVGIDEYKKDEIKEIVKEVLEENKTNMVQEQNPVKTESSGDTKGDITKKESVSKGQCASTTSRSMPEPRDENDGNILTGYRVTSYYPGDGCASTNKTGSGKTTKDFSTMKVGNKDVYTYKGKIVCAAATNELLKSGYSVKGAQQKQDKHYFSYGDEIKLKINNKYYNAIILDSCGASMWKGEYRIDIFVPTSSDVVNAYNTTIKM